MQRIEIDWAGFNDAGQNVAELTIPLDANRVGCRLNLRVVQEVKEDRSGFTARVFLQHNIAGRMYDLVNKTIDTEVGPWDPKFQPGPLPAIRLALAGRELAGDKATLDAIELLTREMS